MSQKIETKNPYNGNILETYDLFTNKLIETCLNKSQNTYNIWKTKSLKDRTDLLHQLSLQLEKQKEPIAKLMTSEMGKPYKDSIAEIEKCIWLIDFYKKNASQFLADEIIKTEAIESFISYDPLGCILAVMPWNYPLWQVMRFAVPTLTAGNTALLKHANNVTGCSLAIEKVFIDAGYPEGCFQTLIADHDQISKVIENDIVKAVSLTGSEKAGRSIAATAANHLKKAVLELGGNNACIIWEDADLDKHISTIMKARMQNAGQSCIAAKRFIVVDKIYDEFIEKFKKEIKNLIIGDPQQSDTTFGVLADTQFAEGIAEQVQKSIEMGATVEMGNQHKGAFYAPTIVSNVQPGMPLFDEEIFGPVAAVIKAKNRDEAIQLATLSRFGLGTMLFTKDIEGARKRIQQIPDGAFFINEMVKSDPRLPFGGTKNSGYGRELSKEGILEFINKKTVYIAN